jgi:hypothetical protein
VRHSLAGFPAPPGANRLSTERAEVTGIRRERCPVPGARECLRVTAKLETGPDQEEETTFAVVDAARQVGLDVGDKVRLAPNPLPPGASIGGVRPDRYSLADFEQRMPLLWLALAFAAIFNLSGTSFSDAINNEAVAAEVVATLVGSIGLIAAVPVTTAIAALLATRSAAGPLAAPHPHAH